MKKNLLSLAVISALSISFTACGGGGSSSPSDNNNNGGGDTTTNIEVERGKVYDANITDSSNPVKVATMTVGSNVYTFSTTPTYPIKAVGGWIDVDGDGNMTTSDVVNDLNLTSYSKVITPITTYLGDINSTQGKARLEQLISDMNTTEADLLKVPSKSNKNAIVVQNAIYNVMKTRGTTDIGSHYSDINSSFTTLKTYVDSDPSKTTAAQISLFAESKVVSDLTTGGKITKLDSAKISVIESKRPGASNDNSSDNNSSNSGDSSSNDDNNDTFTYSTITSSITGKVWMDRNLGAKQVCNNINDSDCFGDYYQLGRDANGYEKIDSEITTTLSDTTNPNHSKFILNTTPDSYKGDWMSNDTFGEQRENWNPCPTNFRLPTSDEFSAEITKEDTSKRDGHEMFATLKLGMGGERLYNTGNLSPTGFNGAGRYLLDPTGAATDYVSNGEVLTLSVVGYSSQVPVFKPAANGFNVRCIQK
jgi:predicted small lipoprotein YifL